MRVCLSVHMPVSKLEGRNCGVPNQWWVNHLYFWHFPFTFYGQFWAQCLVYIMGVGGIWNTGVSCVVMHNSEWKFSFLRFFAFFLVWQPPFDLNITKFIIYLTCFLSIVCGIFLWIMQQRERLKGIPRNKLAIICLMNSNPPIPDISDSYLDNLCECHIS